MIWYYGRVSTDHQEDSAANQRQVFEELASEAGEPYQIVVWDKTCQYNTIFG